MNCKSQLRTLGLAMACVAMLPAWAAEQGDWKRGRLYYRSVCTSCHKEAGKAISPLDKTIAAETEHMTPLMKVLKHLDDTGRRATSIFPPRSLSKSKAWRG